MGLVRKVSNWSVLRLEALERDGYRCGDCGKSGRLEVHHLQALKDGGSNELANLLTLCVGCHIRAHKPATMLGQSELDDMVSELL